MENKLNLWVECQKEQRENLFMRKRLLPVSPTNSCSTEYLTDNDMKILAKYFQKPASPECELALRRFKNAFVKYPDVLPLKFAKLPNALPNLVSIFTDLSLDTKIQLLAADCLTSLSVSKNPKVGEQILKFAGSYLTQYLKSSNKKLVFSCILTICNLTIRPNGKSWKILESIGTEHYLMKFTDPGYDVLTMESALFALMHLLLNSKSAVLARNILSQKHFMEFLFRNINREKISSTEISFELQLYSCWILFCLTKTDEFLINTTLATVLVHALDEAISHDEWKLSLIFPIIRILSSMLSKDWRIDEDGNDFALKLVEISIKFIQSQYVPLRKETLWLMTNLVSELPNNVVCFADNCVVEKVIKVVSVSIDDDVINLALSFLYNCVTREFLKKIDCRQILAVSFSSNVPPPSDSVSVAYNQLVALCSDA